MKQTHVKIIRKRKSTRRVPRYCSRTHLFHLRLSFACIPALPTSSIKSCTAGSQDSSCKCNYPERRRDVLQTGRSRAEKIVIATRASYGRGLWIKGLRAVSNSRNIDLFVERNIPKNIPAKFQVGDFTITQKLLPQNSW